MAKPKATTANINGKSIDLALNLGRVIYGKQNGQDIGDLENGPISTMFMDPEVLGETVWAAYQDKLGELGYESDEAFFEVFTGDVRRAVESAMKEAVSDFFSWGAAVIEQIEAELEKMGETMNAFRQSGQMFGNTLDSSESNPGTSPTAS
ncbi:MAG: hypothetical protein KDB00_05995 [Planctomycetales bacterium]|nr:hypothetical protein [Planctomycetales bacterium]